MAARYCRWLQFSLCGLAVLLALLAVGLSIVVNRAHEKRKAVSGIVSCGGAVHYDCQSGAASAGDDGVVEIAFGSGEPDALKWLRRLLGDDYFQSLDAVAILQPDVRVLSSLPYLKRLRSLKTFYIGAAGADETRRRLRAELPHCNVTVIHSFRKQQGRLLTIRP